MTHDSDNEILTRRAKALARERTQSGSSLETVHDRYLVVVCGSDRIVVALESVLEVFRPSSVTPLPRSIPPLYGLTPWRGSILPVIVFDQSAPAQGSGVVVTLASGPRVIAGLWAQEVEGEMAIARNEIHAASNAAGIRASLLSGVTSDAKSVFDADSLARVLDERTKTKDRAAVQNSTGNQA